MFCLVGFVVFGWLATLLFCTILSPEMCMWSVTTFFLGGECDYVFKQIFSPHFISHWCGSAEWGRKGEWRKGDVMGLKV